MPHLIALPPLLTNFALTAIFSFVIGLELHSYRRANRHDLGFGTTRTFTLIGVMGFALYALDARGWLYGAGLLLLGGLLALYYARRARGAGYSLLSPLLAVLTYLIGPVALRFPAWFLVLFVVTVLLMLGEKPGIRRFSDAFHSEEMVTSAKFLIMAGVVLPLLPNKEIAPFITVTYYQVWLAMLVVSGLSYLSYLAQTYLFKERGLLLTGVLGGLYSSTAATVVIARRSSGATSSAIVSPALILATAMMYLRLLLLILVLGGAASAKELLGPFLVFLLSSLIAAGLIHRFAPADHSDTPPPPVKHPLELLTAFLFALLFVLFTALTQLVVSHFGNGGLHMLSFAIGLTDIDPFILSLLAGKFQVTTNAIIAAVIIAAGSNNLLKAGYALVLGRNRASLPAALWLTGLFAASLAYVGWGLR